ncbi:MAG: hypothetical protein ABI167_00970 [Nitrosospira sp.]
MSWFQFFDEPATSIFSVAAGLVFHNVTGDQDQFIHLMKNIAMAGGLIQVVAFGGGAFGIDSRPHYGGANTKTAFGSHP